jgi:hypothetical protein
VALAAAAAGLGCELVIGLDQLDNGQCKSNEKACLGKCVLKNQPNTGCGDPNICSPCFLPHESAACAFDNDAGMYVCAGNGVCEANSGFKDCTKDDPSDPSTLGCETDTNHDPNNCGGCSGANAIYKCQTPPNGYPGCKAGVCAIMGCMPGFFDCDCNVTDGCEATAPCATPCPS